MQTLQFSVEKSGEWKLEILMMFFCVVVMNGTVGTPYLLGTTVRIVPDFQYLVLIVVPTGVRGYVGSH